MALKFNHTDALLVALVVACVSSIQLSLATSLPSSTNELANEINSDAGEQQQQQPSRQDSGIKRYLFRVDADSANIYQPKGSKEQWNVVRVGQLLDALSESMPSPSEIPAPILRTGRTYPSSMGGLSFSQVAQNGGGLVVRGSAIDQPTDYPSKGQMMAGAGNRMQPLRGLVWAQSTRPMVLPPPFYGSSAKYQAINSLQGAGSGPKGSGSGASGSRARVQRISGGVGGAEFPFQTAELKRVENSRWNNLRGMWGKRNDNFMASNQLSIPVEQRSEAGDGATSAASGAAM